MNPVKSKIYFVRGEGERSTLVGMKMLCDLIQYNFAVQLQEQELAIETCTCGLTL